MKFMQIVIFLSYKQTNMEVKIFTTKEYSRKFKVANKYVSEKTISRMCEENLLPTWCACRKIKTASQSIWIIAVQDQ